MAIHRQSYSQATSQQSASQQSAPQQAAEEPVQERVYSRMGTGRINDLLGDQLTLEDSTDGMLDTVFNAFSQVVSRVSNKAVDVRVHKCLSSEQSPDSRLAYPTIILVVSRDGVAVVMPYIIVPGRLADFDVLNIRNGPETITLPRHPSESFDGRALDDFKTLIFNTSDNRTVYPQDSKCIHAEGMVVFMSGDNDAIMKEARRLLHPAIRIAASTLLVTHLGVIEDVSLANNVDQQSHMSVTYKPAAGLRYDEEGSPVGGMVASVRIEATASDNSNSLNRSNGTFQVGTVAVRASIVHSTGQAVNMQMFTNQQNQRPPMFTPQLILDDMHVNGDPTPANIMLMVASTIPLLNPDAIRRMYNPKDIGYLNTRANLSGDAKPFAEKDVRAAYPQVWNSFFGTSALVSMCVRLGSLSSLYGSMFLRNARNVHGRAEVKAAMEHLFGMDLTGLGDSCRNPVMEVVPIGTYKGEDNQLHPLSEIDLLWLIRHCHARPQLIDQWAMSADGTRDPKTSLAMKMAVLKAVTNGSMNVVDRGMVISFSPDYLRALSMGMSSSRTAIITNLGTLTGMETSRWNAYMGASQSLDLSTFQGFSGATTQAQGMQSSWGPYSQ